MSLFRRETRQWTPEPIVSPFPTSVFGGRGGSPSINRAMQVSAVWACVRLIAESVAMMPLHSFTTNADGVRIPTSTDPPFVKQPSADATMPEWVYMVLVSLLLRGNSYNHIVRRDALGYPVQLEPLDPDSVQPRTDPQTGDLTFRVNGRMMPTAEIMHIRAFRMPGSRLGLSPIEYAARQINTDAAVADFAYNFFNDGAHPSAILSSEQPMTQEQAKSVKERFVSAITGREPAVLTGGMKYQQVQINPNESQFLETQKLGVAGIARIYGVPPEMVAAEAGNSMTYANVEQRALDFLTYTIQPWLTRLESVLSNMFPGEQHLRFDTSVLTRTDLSTLLKATAIGIASKQMTPDEARAKRDMPPLTEAQKKTLELVPLTVGPSGRPTTELNGDGLNLGKGAEPAATGARSLERREAPEPSEFHAHVNITNPVQSGPITVEPAKVTVLDKREKAADVVVNVPEQPAPVVNNEVRVAPAPVMVAHPKRTRTTTRSSVKRDQSGELTGQEAIAETEVIE